jgi:translation initiation factor 4A
MRSIGDFMGIKIHACVGGVAIREDIRTLQEGVHVVVGTPGRLCDIIQRRFMRVDNIKMLTLDEADELLLRGFQDQISDLHTHLPENIQCSVFSPTMPLGALEFCGRILREPIRISVMRDEFSLEGIKQFYVLIEQEEGKLDTLFDLYMSLPNIQTIIYCNPRKVDWLTEQFQSRDISVTAIYEDMNPIKRDVALRDFYSGSTRVLIATDSVGRMVAAQVCTIHYDIPTKRKYYLNRIGGSRRGRFGRNKVSISLITEEDMRYLRDLEEYYCTQIEELPFEILNFDLF